MNAQLAFQKAKQAASPEEMAMLEQQAATALGYALAAIEEYGIPLPTIPAGSPVDRCAIAVRYLAEEVTKRWGRRAAETAISDWQQQASALNEEEHRAVAGPNYEQIRSRIGGETVTFGPLPWEQ